MLRSKNYLSKPTELNNVSETIQIKKKKIRRLGDPRIDIFTLEPNSLVNVWQLMGLKFLTVGIGDYTST